MLDSTNETFLYIEIIALKQLFLLTAEPRVREPASTSQLLKMTRTHKTSPFQQFDIFKFP